MAKTNFFLNRNHDSSVENKTDVEKKILRARDADVEETSEAISLQEAVVDPVASRLQTVHEVETFENHESSDVKEESIIKSLVNGQYYSSLKETIDVEKIKLWPGVFEVDTIKDRPKPICDESMIEIVSSATTLTEACPVTHDKPSDEKPNVSTLPPKARKATKSGADAHTPITRIKDGQSKLTERISSSLCGMSCSAVTSDSDVSPTQERVLHPRDRILKHLKPGVRSTRIPKPGFSKTSLDVKGKGKNTRAVAFQKEVKSGSQNTSSKASRHTSRIRNIVPKKPEKLEIDCDDGNSSQFRERQYSYGSASTATCMKSVATEDAEDRLKELFRRKARNKSSVEMKERRSDESRNPEITRVMTDYSSSVSKKTDMVSLDAVEDSSSSVLPNSAKSTTRVENKSKQRYVGNRKPSLPRGKKDPAVNQPPGAPTSSERLKILRRRVAQQRSSVPRVWSAGKVNI